MFPQMLLILTHIYNNNDSNDYVKSITVAELILRHISALSSFYGAAFFVFPQMLLILTHIFITTMIKTIM